MLVAAGFAVLALAMSWRALTADDQAFERLVGWANILGFCVAVAGFALVVVDRWTSAARPSGQALEDTIDRLAGAVLRREAQQRARLLGTGRITTTAANLRYETERLVRFQDADSTRAGDLECIARYFDDHTEGRLVILGSPGAGKTVLAMELLIQLLEQRSALTNAEKRAKRPVPVRFSLPAWNSEQPLTEWLAKELTDQFGLARPTAHDLVEHSRILPVLDGLDEMDPPNTTPERGNATVAQLNTYLTGRTGLPLVITCRSSDYQRLRESIRPATVIQIQPLTATQISDYVDREYQDSRDAPGRQQWRHVLDHLADQNGTPVLDALATPWRLTLAVTYQRDGGDLVSLLTPGTGKLPTGHTAPAATRNEEYTRQVTTVLLASFIPGRVRVYGDGRYKTEQVNHWCRTIARHLGNQVDIVLHEWWAVAGRQQVVRWHALFAGAITVICSLAAGVAIHGGINISFNYIEIYLQGFPYLPRPYLPPGLMFIWLTITALYLTTRVALKRQISPPLELSFRRLRSFRERRQVELGLAFGFTFGLALGFVAGLEDGLVVGLAFGLAVGFMGGLMVTLAGGAKTTGTVATNPWDPIRNDIIVWLAGGLAFGLSGSLVGGLAFGFADGLAVGLVGGTAVGLMGGLAVELAGHAWLRYVIATILTAGRKELPLRFGKFLDWAHQAGILRIAGNAYQFRHIEIRAWLQDQSDHATIEAGKVSITRSR